jgi:DDE_Tnp_1-associated
MSPFAAFVSILAEIDDPRRAEGKVCRLPHVMLFAILAIVSGANSYRTIHSFIDVHLTRLRKSAKPQLTPRSAVSYVNSTPPAWKRRFAAMLPH